MHTEALQRDGIPRTLFTCQPSNEGGSTAELEWVCLGNADNQLRAPTRADELDHAKARIHSAVGGHEFGTTVSLSDAPRM